VYWSWTMIGFRSLICWLLFLIRCPGIRGICLYCVFNGIAVVFECHSVCWFYIASCRVVTKDIAVNTRIAMYLNCCLCRFHMFNASRQPETVSNAQTVDEEMFARPFDVRMPRVWLKYVNGILTYKYFAVKQITVTEWLRQCGSTFDSCHCPFVSLLVTVWAFGLSC